MKPFFFDMTNPRQFAASLAAFDYDTRHLLGVADFAHREATTDEEWVPYAAERNWVAITGDRRLAAREIFRTHRLTTFFLPKGYTNLRLWPQYEILVRAWTQIVELADRAHVGDCFDVQMNGKVTLFTK